MPWRGRLLACSVLWLLLPTAAAAPGIAVVVSHPYPDDADPLGVPFDGDVDVYVVRHGHRSASLSYPNIVVDGVHHVDGLPDPERPEAALQENLSAAWEDRAGTEPPVEMALRLEEVAPGTIRVQVETMPRDALAPGTVWVALTEDHVRFRPPAAVSNGVFDHRFTLRAIERLPQASLDGPAVHNVSIDVDEAWVAKRLSIVAWTEADASGSRFAPQEVLQAITLAGPLVEGRHVQQSERAVLIEMRSATWCDPCLFGDRIVEEMAQVHGLVDDAPPRQLTTYWQAPANTPLVLLAMLAGALAMTWLARRRP